jgi:phenylalanyl-tRNA synthetase beta chain
MKISRNWLQNFFVETLPETEVLSDALTLHAFEIDGVERIGNDDVLDVKVTPNRGHDCLSHRGIAAEVSAILKLPMSSEKDPFAKTPNLSKGTSEVSVTLETPLAHRYIAGIMRGVTVGPSPEWLQTALEALGQRSINNIVDATNLVMFNTGQPLHAFDIAKLKMVDAGVAISVRAARAGEKIVALDGKEYALADSMLVIADGYADAPIGIAGVKGGKASEIDGGTVDILIESANFHGVAVRKAAQALKLRTDASARFEQVLSPELAAYGMQQVVDLITTLAGGEVIGFVDAYPSPQKPTTVSVSHEKINHLLGIELSRTEVTDTFARLGFPYTEEDEVYTVTPPFQRLDLEIPEDLIEEVVRTIGYDRIPAVPLPPAEGPAAMHPHFYAAEKAREALVAHGYSEVFTSVFSEQGERAVANKLGGDRPYLRNSLLLGLESALARNIPHKDLLGIKEVKLFEIGVVWSGGKERMMVGTISEKEKAKEEDLLPEVANHYASLPLSETGRYEPFSKYPYIVRDIALWVPAGITDGEVRTIIASHAGPLLVGVRLFDTFAKNERISYAFRLIFQSFERTLTDTEVGESMERISDALKAEHFEIR